MLSVVLYFCVCFIQWKKVTGLFYVSVSGNSISKRIQLEILHCDILAQKDNLGQMGLYSILLVAV